MTTPTYHFAGFDYDYQTVEALKPTGLVALYNQLTGRATKKFASRAKGIQQTWMALEANGIPVTKVPAGQTAKKRAKAEAKGMQMVTDALHGAPAVAHSPKADALGGVIQLLKHQDGAALEEIASYLGTTEKRARTAIDKLRKGGAKVELYAPKRWRIA